VKQLINFTFGRLVTTNLSFHYFRIGQAKPLVDELSTYSEDKFIDGLGIMKGKYKVKEKLSKEGNSGLEDDMKEQSVKWHQHEVEFFHQYQFKESYGRFDGAIINIDIDEDNVTQQRREFWEHFIWKTSEMPLPVAIVIPSTQGYGSLSKAQVFEYLSLIRLTDRPFELFEYNENVVSEVYGWLTRLSSLVHRKKREEMSD